MRCQPFGREYLKDGGRRSERIGGGKRMRNGKGMKEEVGRGVKERGRGGGLATGHPMTTERGSKVFPLSRFP